MFLNRIEIAGFKSFGGRIKVDLHGGIAGIVGPNGAGKSNLADALRWVLGEQSIKLLRLKKTEEVIFSGTDKRSRASMAEVSLRLDNSDGAVPIDFSEIQLTRRLYRSGESEYLLNGRKVRLSDIENLLARSGFGTGSYTVVGQGMIDQLLLASPADRKAMFDEASGIKAYELDRRAHLKKLEKSQQNLDQVEAVLRELMPQQSVLQSQAELLHKRTAIIEQLHQMRTKYLSYETGNCTGAIKQTQAEIEDSAKLLKQYADEEKDLRGQLERLSKDRAAQSNQAEKRALLLKKLETSRDEVFNKLAQLRAQNDLILQIQKDNPTMDLATLQKQSGECQKSLKRISARIEKLESKIAAHQQQITQYDEKLKLIHLDQNKLRTQIIRNSKSQYLQHALGLTKILNDHYIDKKPVSSEQLNITIHKLARFLRLAIEQQPEELPAQLSRLQNQATRLMANREDVVEQQTAEIIKLRALELDQSAYEAELADIAKSLKDHKQEDNSADQKKKDVELTRYQSKLDELDREIEASRAVLFDNQTSEIDETQRRLNESIQTTLVQLTRQQATHKEAEQQLRDKRTQLSDLEVLAKRWQMTISTKGAVREQVAISAISRLEGELEMIAEIDPKLLEEVAELDSRLLFLQFQVKDLSAAITDTQKVVSKLETKIAAQFSRNFKRINTQFDHFFKELFGGGNAELQLKETDQQEFGIDIVVSPPGKRLGLLSSLSGGEKALSSIALLAAILSVNPSPFVILDEVDAALDELNSVKFGKILREIAQHSQVLVITHNHQTMQVAAELLGITTISDGSSSILSVQLETAEAMSH